MFSKIINLSYQGKDKKMEEHANVKIAWKIVIYTVLMSMQR